MRVTVDSGDPDWIGADGAGRYKVTVDGFKVDRVYEADDQRGYVKAFAKDKNGRVYLNKLGTEPERVTHYGVVCIIDTRAQ